MSRPLRMECLHVYRDLLRAATYLPDPAVRTYVHSHIRRRFRAAKSTDEDQERDIVLDKRHFLKAKQNARSVWRAANGDPSDLQRLFYLTYGRAGRRRRILIDEIVRRPDSFLPIDGTALQQRIVQRKGSGQAPRKPSPSSQSTMTAVPPKAIDPQSLPRTLPHSTSKLGTLIDSQINRHPRSSPRSTLRARRPTIPKTGARGKPLAVCRQRNITRKWFAETLDRLMPPVSLDEWETLRDLATGVLPIERLHARRSRAAEDTRLTDDDSLLKFLTNPTRFTASAHELAIDGEKRTLFLEQKNESVMRIQSARSMRRLYHAVWALTPTMVFDEGIQKWKVQWGDEKAPFRRRALPRLTAADLELFEEVGPDITPSGQKMKFEIGYK